MEHVHPVVRPILEKSVQERTYFARAHRWIGHAEAKEILARMEDFLTAPPDDSTPGILLLGEPGFGKSTVLKKFLSQHPGVIDPERECSHIPVLLVECSGPDERRFLHEIMDQLGAVYSDSSRIERKCKTIKELIEKVQTKVIMVDELHNIMVGNIAARNRFLTMLKTLDNTLTAKFVLAGTDEARNALSLERQLARRFTEMELPQWADKKKFSLLLNSFEKLLPLRRPSRLAQESMADELHARSEGIIGELAFLLTEATCIALARGEEEITLKTIRAVRHVPPSRRRDLQAHRDLPASDPYAEIPPPSDGGSPDSETEEASAS